MPCHRFESPMDPIDLAATLWVPSLPKLEAARITGTFSSRTQSPAQAHGSKPFSGASPFGGPLSIPSMNAGLVCQEVINVSPHHCRLWTG